MDVDNENFYNELASFMPQPGYYSLEDLDEIIPLNDSQLDVSLDTNEFVNDFYQNDFDMTLDHSSKIEENDSNHFEQILPSLKQEKCSIEDETPINFEDAYLINSLQFHSPAPSHQSAGYSSPFETPAHTSSPTAIGDDHFCPDDFLSFLNDDNIKINDLTTDTIMKPDERSYRNTPSPTGSCSSSAGSSTSGVQSDASSLVSLSQNCKSTKYEEMDDDLLEFVKFKNEQLDPEKILNDTFLSQSEQPLDNDCVVAKDENVVLQTNSSEITITTPIAPVTLTPSIKPVNFVQGLTIPLQTVPLTEVNSLISLQAPSTNKITENKPSASPFKTVVAQPVKLATTLTNTTANTNPKITAPPNSKPKTIFLSSNDFKALMQKVNTSSKTIAGASNQIPKIIVKTTNGKVIAGSKVTNNANNNPIVSPSTSCNSNSLKTATSSNSPSSQFTSKLTKVSGPLTVKQQPSKPVLSNVRSTANMSTSRATLGHTKNFRTDLTLLKGLSDDKLLKKQLRMLKNRESASLSRKKKKEYIERLENRISDLEKENYSLKGENSSLRSQLMAFAQTCNCKHGNISEFILNTLNMDVKSGGATLQTIDTSYLLNNVKLHLDNCSGKNSSNLNGATISTKHHVKIAPKPANSDQLLNKNLKQRMNATTVKKNVAVLLAMAFMVTLNVGNFQNYLNKPALENAIEATVSGGNEESVVTGRRLLWVPNKDEFHEQTNRSKREVDITNMPPPPLHFLRPVNRTTADKMNGNTAKDEPHIQSPLANYANATQENMRLARNLHKWIDGNDYLNLTGNGVGNNIEEMEDFKFGAGSYMDYELPLHVGAKKRRKIISDTHMQEKDEIHRSSLDIFKPMISEEYLKLFKGIKRQDDTFYVLSFNMDHILLPASTYNKSSRPKMSLMLPASGPSSNGDVVLMQIDCQVMNTTELEIKSHIIPENLRPSKYSTNLRVNPNDVANNNTAAPASVVSTKSNGLLLKKEEVLKNPPNPPTYFMMGPKNKPTSQSTKSIVSEPNKRKSRLVKLNANDSVIGSGILNVRNTSLFSRMRETIDANDFATAANVKKLI